jgi:hypothetical protein
MLKSKIQNVKKYKPYYTNLTEILRRFFENYTFFWSKHENLIILSILGKILGKKTCKIFSKYAFSPKVLFKNRQGTCRSIEL